MPGVLSPVSRTPSVLSKLNQTFVNSHNPSTRNLSRDTLEQEEAKLRASMEKVSLDHEREEKQERQRAEVAKKRKDADEKAAREEPATLRANYGVLSSHQIVPKDKHMTTDVKELAKDHKLGKQVAFRARIHAIRNVSAHLAFVVLRQQEITIQGVLKQQEGKVSEHWIRWVEHLSPETVVFVQGVLKKPEQEVKSCTIHDSEIGIEALHVVAEVSETLPFNVYNADVMDAEIQSEVPWEKDISGSFRLTNRILDLRTATSLAIFRINASISNVFRTNLDSQGFVEIHTPKLQRGATESGASVFKLDYFGRPAYLAQSPQLAKQMAISADMERVYEIGPVFRAENSNTKRHLTEYTGLDLEMAISESYYEALDVIDAMFKDVWETIYSRNRHEIDVVKRRFPHDDLVWLDETPRLPFQKGIEILRASGWTDDAGEPPSEYEDLSTRAEIRLGELVKEQYKTDYYILDKFPASARPFYTMRDSKDSELTNSFDIFLRGQEILSGGQRIHDANILEDQMKSLRMQLEGMEDYLEGFRWGAPPHAGGGTGLERVAMLLLGLGNIRLASLFPRDPQSIKAMPQTDKLRHPEASTLHPPWQADHGIDGVELQPLEKLIANYGDATNTSYLEERTKIWRCELTGAAIGWAPVSDHAIVFGDPLCEHVQYAAIIIAFLRYLNKEHRHLKPIWVLIGPHTERVLADKLNWNTISCAAEQRTETASTQRARDRLSQKLNAAKRNGVRLSSLPRGETPPEVFQAEAAECIDDWQASRKGKQVHLSELSTKQVFLDCAHRWFFAARSPPPDSRLEALVALAQLSPAHGWQVKYSVDRPGAPSGAIEALTVHALEAARAAGVDNVTFGSGATPELEAVHGLRGVRVRVLRRTYKEIAAALGTRRKSEFRQKLGAHEDPIYLAFPKRGLGPGGIKAVMTFFGAD